MTHANKWHQATQKFNDEKVRLQKSAYTSSKALALIDVAEEMTGQRMSLNDAISHIAKSNI